MATNGIPGFAIIPNGETEDTAIAVSDLIDGQMLANLRVPAAGKITAIEVDS